MNNQIVMYILIGSVVLLIGIVIAFFVLRRKNEDAKYARELQRGTKTKSFNSEVIYQKLYVFYLRSLHIPKYTLFLLLLFYLCGKFLLHLQLTFLQKEML